MRARAIKDVVMIGTRVTGKATAPAHYNTGTVSAAHRIIDGDIASVGGEGQ